jgi:hypothetical protein
MTHIPGKEDGYDFLRPTSQYDSTELEYVQGPDHSN